MKPTLLALALAAGAAAAASPQPAAAHGSMNINGHQCSVDTDWSVRMHRRAFVFSREGKDPAEVGIGGGRLFIDGKEQKLSAADHARLSRIEQEMTDSLPLLQDIVVEAVDIAFYALTEVARGLASDPKATIAELQSAQVKVRAEMQSKPLAAFGGDEIGRIIEPVVEDFVPNIVGGAVSGALGAAFGGEKKANEFEARMNRMEQELDRNVEARAKLLEPKAEEMCERMKSIDQIDNQMEYRLPDGEPLELLRVGQRDKD
jgi:hypothetical protein